MENVFISANNLYNLLDAEIKWHIDYASTHSDDCEIFDVGYISGLKQSKKLIKQLEETCDDGHIVVSFT